MPVSNSYLPPKDQDLNAWATNFDTLITGSPATFGLTSGQATTYHALRQTFSTTLAAAVNPATRTKATVAAKNAARASLLVNTRSLAKIVQGTPTVTNDERAQLGLTIRNTIPTPIGPPTTSPIITPLNSAALAIDFRIADSATPASRKRPFGAIGCNLYVSTATTAPTDTTECKFVGMYTKNTTGPGSAACRVAFASADRGKTAYFLAQWQNRRGEVGPTSALSQMTVAA